MINYVNNSFDKVLKPCDAQRFHTLTTCEQTERLILGHRAGEKNSKAKLPALTYMGVLDEPRYKAYLVQCEEQGTKPLGSRRAEFMRPTGLLMMDFDHVGDPHKVYQALLDAMMADCRKCEDWLALAHITPSGDGLRLVLKREKGKTIEQEQHGWFLCIEEYCAGLKFDAVCKDISRLSFAPMQKEILYYNPSLLFAPLPDAAEYPDGTLFSGVAGVRSAGVQTNASTMSGGYPLRTSCSSPLKGDSAESTGSAANESNQKELSPFKGDERNGAGRNGAEGVTEYPTSYEGMEYTEIVQRLEEQLGGRPEHGARNSFIFTMACNLRYICNDDPAWVASILPTYGEDPQKHRATIHSAVNRPMSRTMPETLTRALRVAQGELSIVNCELSIATPPAMPAALPAPLDMLISRTPQPMRPAVAMAVFPPLGAHLHEAKFHYWDNRDYEPTFMNVLVAELSSGKSAVNTPIEYIIADIEARDDVAREREQEWKNQCATISNAKDKPQRPKGLAVQCLSADMTNAAFVQRLADAEGRFLYTMMDEIELLDSLKTNTRGGSVSAVLRLAFDCGKYGQERVASNAVNAKVRVRWNWNASTTVQRVRKYFAHSIADGTLSRLSFSTILKSDEDWGDTHRPVYGDYGQAFADALHPYIDALCSCKGTLRCPEAEQWALSLSDELVDFARQLDDRTYATMSFRAVLMGFFRAMVLYVMNGCRWTTVIADFAAWSVRYDLWCKMRFFRDMLHKDLEGEKTALQRGPVSLLTLLPMEFTRQQAEELRVAQGMKPNPKAMLSTWKKRGYVTLDEQRGVYVQTKRS
ncbi:MAG: hypothetical protein IKJ09_00390 [Bacteroidaceae bacterium]|nr:hypothetical protein [Bacteroidaceae bacterium]MBR4040761.1 hypothetical protein [Bacteroidaceae bacterium]